MRWLGFVLLLIAAPAFAQAPVLTLASDTEARWVAFELTPHNQIRFTLDLDGAPVTALLDTAVSSSTLSRDQAARMKLRTRGEHSAAAIGGSVGLQWAQARSIAFGGLRRTGGALAVIDLAETATSGDPGVAMLVGADLVAGYALDIDYPGRRFRLLQPGRMPFQGAAMPLRIGTDLRFYLSEIELDGRRVRPMVIDTGDGSAMTVASDVWAPRRGQRMTSTMSRGLAGPAITDLTVMAELKLGALVARNVPLNIERADGYSRRIGVSGRIGSGFLRHYRVLLDPTAGHMLLSRGPDADLPPQKSTSGLLVERQGDALVVLHVMTGGPGESAGWRAGERICSVDGVSPPTGDWPAGTPGRTVALGLCGGETRSLKLAAFY
jgi:hypothetical protein